MLIKNITEKRFNVFFRINHKKFLISFIFLQKLFHRAIRTGG